MEYSLNWKREDRIDRRLSTDVHMMIGNKDKKKKGTTTKGESSADTQGGKKFVSVHYKINDTQRQKCFLHD
ncbi:hypothetical protein PAXRUDRAFT_621529 [Paxillus rubicundulus Ve08.2h10]|uniref:Uncharacterized protein n=1 Tax=Paxillus rubicundulus Ve08.2h10 TaxID=930991 RepID=A0A0D0D4U1_9AGAM|nr:hypothetical protein PAXRUDRAFT_621529 [Paxillus rubicundulus Ve08.2h10]